MKNMWPLSAIFKVECCTSKHTHQHHHFNLISSNSARTHTHSQKHMLTIQRRRHKQSTTTVCARAWWIWLTKWTGQKNLYIGFHFHFEFNIWSTLKERKNTEYDNIECKVHRAAAAQPQNSLRKRIQNHSSSIRIPAKFSIFSSLLTLIYSFQQKC